MAVISVGVGAGGVGGVGGGDGGFGLPGGLLEVGGGVVVAVRFKPPQPERSSSKNARQTEYAIDIEGTRFDTTTFLSPALEAAALPRVAESLSVRFRKNGTSLRQTLARPAASLAVLNCGGCWIGREPEEVHLRLILRSDFLFTFSAAQPWFRGRGLLPIAR
jgi:hypothetical protein